MFRCVLAAAILHLCLLFAIDGASLCLKVSLNLCASWRCFFFLPFEVFFLIATSCDVDYSSIGLNLLDIILNSENEHQGLWRLSCLASIGYRTFFPFYMLIVHHTGTHSGTHTGWISILYCVLFCIAFLQCVTNEFT